MDGTMNGVQKYMCFSFLGFEVLFWFFNFFAGNLTGNNDIMSYDDNCYKL
jgi:hypothetical protein